MNWLLHTLAQTTVPSSAPAVPVSPAASVAEPASPYTLDWAKWFTIHGWQTALASAATLLLIILLGYILSGIFRKFIDRHRLLRPIRWGTFAIAVYAALIVIHNARMLDPHDILALTFHKLFIAIMLLVILCFFDRLIVIPILTRGGRVNLSRFIHQITLAILCLFLAAGYLHWAFDVDVSSVLAGSAVISIVLGLALQETLGNFFSGMVLQASVPFAAGDWILIGEGSTAVEGRVVEMTWRAVTMITSSNNNILIPNSVVARTKITNYHTPTPATTFSVNLALDRELPPHEARRVLLLAARDTAGIVADPAPGVSISSYDRSTITYSLGFWIDRPDQHGSVEAAVRWNVWYRLQQAGIHLPFDTQTVELVNPAPQNQNSANSAVAQRLAAIHKCPLFSTLSPELQQKLASQIMDFHLAPGQVFYRQNDPGNSLFLIISGTAHATMRTSDGRDIDIGDISTGSVFGEASGLTGQPRTATVIAKTDVRAAEITHEHLQELLAKDLALAKHMSEIVARSQARHEELAAKQGAVHPAHSPSTHPHSVLDRMRSFLHF